jgi:hypothetical protein
MEESELSTKLRSSVEPVFRKKTWAQVVNTTTSMQETWKNSRARMRGTRLRTMAKIPIHSAAYPRLNRRSERT